MLGLTLLTAALLPASMMAIPTPAGPVPQVVPSTSGPAAPAHAGNAKDENALEKRHYGMYGYPGYGYGYASPYPYGYGVYPYG